MTDPNIPFPTDDDSNQGAADAQLPSTDGDDLSYEQLELERLYQQALNTMDAVGEDLDATAEILSLDDDDDESVDDFSPEANSASPSIEAEATDLRNAEIPIDETSEPGLTLPEVEPSPASTTVESLKPSKERVTPRQIIEAALFVGGGPLKMKQLVDLLGGEFSNDDVDQLIDDLNRQYADENRPYGIQFGEGGYQLNLHEEFYSVRDRAFGLGPKEVKLSQEALEVLALVAYQQPISKVAVEEAGSSKSATLLRQLLRRQLIALERVDDKKSDVVYHTTPRFLEVFGLANLDELPQAGDLSFK